MAEIDNYQDSSPDESDNVESSEGKSDSEESSRDEEDPLSLPICARDISGELYDLAMWLEEFVDPYLTPTVCEMEKNYMATFKPYTDEVKDTIIDVLKAQLKGVTVLTSGVESVDDEYLADHNIVQSCVNSVSSKQKNVSSDHVDEVAVDAVDEVAIDAVDEVAGDIVDEVVVDDVAGVVDPVTVDIVDEVIGNAIDEVTEQKEEEKKKEKSVDDEEEKEEDDYAENDQWM
ncbi:hypothetical protein KY285_036240 [Solanum tuberosum]|nr:hypothetical protein KY285_036240 [Solanum tuberosum]